MLRRLLFLLSPSDELLRQKHKNHIQRFQIWCHRRILILLAKSYGTYAIIDMIKLGDVEIIHECRDLEFERELQRITKKTIGKPTLKAIGFPYHGNRGPLSRHISDFRFTDTLSVEFEGEKYSIKREDELLEMEGNMKGTLKYSSYEDVLRCSEFISKSRSRKKTTEKGTDNTLITPIKRETGINEDGNLGPDCNGPKASAGPDPNTPSKSPGPKKEEKGPTKVLIKREDPKSLVPDLESKPEIPPLPPPLPPSIKKRASVEIDESFNIKK